MRWSRIKNIIILLLVTVNLFLLSLVGLRAWRTQRGERETRERMLQVLANNGIDFAAGEVPGALELLPRQVTAQVPGPDQAAALVGAISGQEVLGTRTIYTGEQGTVTVSASGELTVEFLPDDSLTEAAVLERVSKLGVKLRETGRSYDVGDPTVTYIQLWDGVPLPGETAVFASRARYPHTLTFRLLAGTEEPVTGSGELITASTALTRFLKALNDGGYVCSQVTGMYPGYLTSGTGTVSLTPAWFVETDAWPWRFAVDGYTGNVTAAE